MTWSNALAWIALCSRVPVVRVAGDDVVAYRGFEDIGFLRHQRGDAAEVRRPGGVPAVYLQLQGLGG